MANHSLLTKNAISRILDGEDVQNPRLQVLGYKKVGDASDGKGIIRYRFLLSDGNATHRFCVMSGNLVERVEKREFEKFSVIELRNYVLHNFKDGKAIIIIDPKVIKGEVDPKQESLIDCEQQIQRTRRIRSFVIDDEDNCEEIKKCTGDVKNFLNNEAELSGSDSSDDENDDESIENEENETAFINDNTSESCGSTVEENEVESKVDIKSFFDNEAELSGSEASSDEAEDEDDEIVQQDPEEELPSDDELRNEIGRVYFKQEMDEDKRKLLRYQEQFLDDGDLHGDGKVREKKFHWKNVDNTAWRDITESEGSEDDDDAPKPVFKLKPLNDVKFEQKVNTTEVESSLSCDLLKRRMFGGPSNNITSYIVRDEKLKSVLSLNRKRNSPFRNKQTKRLKSTRKEDKESIFDIFASL